MNADSTLGIKQITPLKLFMLERWWLRPPSLLAVAPDLSPYPEDRTVDWRRRSFPLTDILAGLEEGTKVDPGLSDLKPELFLVCLPEE